MIRANDPLLKSWVPVPEHCDFPIQNLPLGVIKRGDAYHVASRIGDLVIDLAELNKSGLLGVNYVDSVFENEFINDCIGLGKEMMRELRNRLSQLLDERRTELKHNLDLREQCMFPAKDVELSMPIKVRNYTDFYSSKEHATNVGSMFRDPANALPANWKHLPIGYHGRASSIVVSGTDIIRPKGQMKTAEQEVPVFGPTQQLDFELELAFVTCAASNLGTSVSTDEAEDYIFGMVLFNDWSARDIQSWEYVPLGPFLGKNFASSISGWVVPLDALQPFKTSGPEQDPTPLPYLQTSGPQNYDISLEVYLETTRFMPTKIIQTNSKYLYWNIPQQLAHHTINGCNLQVGDVYASGTISGPERSSVGSMLELTRRGSEPLQMLNNTERKFIMDHDTVIMKGFAQKNGVRIGFGELVNTVLPAI